MEEKIQDILEKKVKLELVYPDNLETKFVNHIIVQNLKEYFTLSFYEAMIPPVVGDTEDERKSIFEKIEKVDAKCVARVIITPEKMKKLIDILQTNYKKLAPEQKLEGK